MRAIHRALVLSLMLACSVGEHARAADVPTSGQRDARIRYIDYASDQVTVITVRRGVVTRITLEPGEKIAVSATGFSANCAVDTNEWCIRADVGSNQIWVKPRDGASHNNLEVLTDKRDYSIEFRVLPDASGGRGEQARLTDEPMYRVIYRYPLGVSLTQMLQGRQASAMRTAAASTQQRAELPQPRNWQYTMQVLKGGDDIAPGLVFDDGRFTYFQFPGNREIPAIFYVSANGEEGRVNYHMQDELFVVHRTARKFVLRLGEAIVGVFNEKFDPDGVPTDQGTTSPSVRRSLRSPQ